MALPMTAARPGPASDDWVPVAACTLPTGERPLRMAEFDDLFAASLRAVERPSGVATRARLLLTGDVGLRDRVQRLVDAETSCCSFFTFVLEALPGDAAVGHVPGTSLALDIEVPAAHADVLAGLVARAERVLT
jgi:hypothetical protein